MNKVTCCCVVIIAVCTLLTSQAFALVELPSDETIEARMDELIDTTPDAEEKALRSAAKLVDKGVKSHNRGKYKKAIKYYEKALKKVPTFGGAYYELALSHYSLKQYKEAYINIVRALVTNPGVEMAYIVKSSILDDAGYPERSVSELNRILKINPESAMAWMNLGITQLKQEHYVDAERSLLAASRYDVDNPSPMYFLFVCASVQGFTYEEEKWISRYLDVADKNDRRRGLAEERLQELHSEKIYIDPTSNTPELDLIEGLVRRQWSLKKHRETYPNERGYKRSLEEEKAVAEFLLAFAEEKQESLKVADNERLLALKTLQDLGYLEAFFYVELQDHLGAVDTAWAHENKALIEEFLYWRDSSDA